jgi:hypothetical protein
MLGNQRRDAEQNDGDGLADLIPSLCVHVRILLQREAAGKAASPDRRTVTVGHQVTMSRGNAPWSLRIPALLTCVL